jgi:hypothetical protein
MHFRSIMIIVKQLFKALHPLSVPHFLASESESALARGRVRYSQQPEELTFIYYGFISTEDSGFRHLSWIDQHVLFSRSSSSTAILHHARSQKKLSIYHRFIGKVSMWRNMLLKSR